MNPIARPFFVCFAGLLVAGFGGAGVACAPSKHAPDTVPGSACHTRWPHAYHRVFDDAFGRERAGLTQDVVRGCPLDVSWCKPVLVGQLRLLFFPAMYGVDFRGRQLLHAEWILSKLSAQARSSALDQFCKLPA